jgi:hypothetical protein
VGVLGQCLVVRRGFVHLTLDDQVPKCDAKGDGFSALDNYHLVVLPVLPRIWPRGLQFTFINRYDIVSWWELLLRVVRDGRLKT